MESNLKLSQKKFPLILLKEDIVISGMSGRFPESDSIDEFRDNLYNNIDMITNDDRRWPTDLYGMNTRMGKLKQIDKFDAQFFGIPIKVADEVDPHARILLETTYEAICDAGLNPQTLRGTNTGVYVGYTSVAMTDSGAKEIQEDMPASRAESLLWFQGNSKAFYSNRVSFVFDLRGPSIAVDTACAASMSALDIALTDLRLAKCEQAVVAGVSVCLQPYPNHIYQTNNIGSKDGISRVWDEKANGYVRAETVASILLQRRTGAKRVYATLLHSKTNFDGYKKLGMFYPSADSQRELMVSTYTEAGVNWRDVTYIEAHGTGTKVGDPQEAKAIYEAYGVGRRTALPIGLLKSNMGHAEGASGLAAIVKVLIAFENRKIPANLNFKSIKPEIASMVPPLLPVCVNLDYEPSIAGINSFGIGGVNCHVLLKANPTPDHQTSDQSLEIAQPMARLVNACGRTASAVEHVFDFIQTSATKTSKQFLSLLDETVANTANKHWAGFPYRGSLVIKRNKVGDSYEYERTVSQVESESATQSPPLWYFFSGMGSQWPAMASDLMKIDIFADSVRKSAQILSPLGVDLLEILSSSDSRLLDSSVNCLVAITAIQAALVDVLTQLGVTPDGLIGHSLGEIGCAYADQSLTLEQAIASAYWRGKCVADSSVGQGMMAAVGLSWSAAQQRCPAGVYLACDNSDHLITISGLEDKVSGFVDELRSENVLAREVQCCRVPFHSPLLASAVQPMAEALTRIIPKPKLRSDKWISTSANESECLSSDAAKYASADYFVNNLVNPVLFRDACARVPRGAVVVEVAPHSLFRSVLKRSLPSVAYVGLLSKDSQHSSAETLVRAVGQLYRLGVNVRVGPLYPPVEWPVCRPTQSISSLIKWDHSRCYSVKKYPEHHCSATASDFVANISLSNADYAFLRDHSIDGRCVMPAAAYLLLAWRRLAVNRGQQWYRFPVAFENIHFKRITTLKAKDSVKLVVRLLDPSGDFVILDSQTVVVSGRIRALSDSQFRYQKLLETHGNFRDEMWSSHALNGKQFYTELDVRGFDFGSNFRCVSEVRYDGLERTHACVEWSGNWTALVESLVQLCVAQPNKWPNSAPNNGTNNGNNNGNNALPIVYVLSSLDSLVCDPRALFAHNYPYDSPTQSHSLLPVIADSKLNIVVANDLELRGLGLAMIGMKNMMSGVKMEKYEFVAHDESRSIDESDADRLRDYIEACEAMARELFDIDVDQEGHQMAGTRAVHSHNVSKWERDERYALGQLLATVGRTAFDPNGVRLESVATLTRLARDLIGEHKYDLSADVLNTANRNRRLMRSVLDIVNENGDRNVRITEMSSGTAVMVDDIVDAMSTYFHYPLVLDYTIVSDSAHKLSASSVGRHRVLTWNHTQHTFPVLDEHQNLIVFRDSFQFWTIDFKSLVTYFMNNSKCGAFLLALFRTRITSAECLLISEKITNEKLAERLDSFKRYALQAGLRLICHKSDSICSDALLLRKVMDASVAPAADQQSVVEVQFGKYDQWVETLKRTFVEHRNRPDGHNVWLVANDADPNGILGLVNCLRLEPGGQRLRCVLSDGLEMALDFGREPLRTLLTNDLVMNVNRDGVWGSYRLLALESGLIEASTESRFDGRKVYVLVGGLGGLGLQTAQWMAASGARKLMLVSRTGIKNDYQWICMKRIESLMRRESTDTTDTIERVVRICTSDVSTEEGVRALLSEASSWGALGGVFHLAAVISDAFIDEQSPQTFATVCAPKAHALHLLDALTRDLCPPLDYFVAISSQSSSRGFVGQSNYGYANSSMERICERRRRAGLHALAIQFGPIGAVGLWAERSDQRRASELAHIGMVIVTQRIPACLRAINTFLRCGHSCDHSIVSTIVRLDAQHSPSTNRSTANNIWNLCGVQWGSRTGSRAGSSAGSSAGSRSEDMSLGELGVDSILVVELQNSIRSEYGVNVGVEHIKMLTEKQIKHFQTAKNDDIKAEIERFIRTTKF